MEIPSIIQDELSIVILVKDLNIFAKLSGDQILTFAIIMEVIQQKENKFSLLMVLERKKNIVTSILSVLRKQGHIVLATATFKIEAMCFFKIMKKKEIFSLLMILKKYEKHIYIIHYYCP